jgi:hypothetical protein
MKQMKQRFCRMNDAKPKIGNARIAERFIPFAELSALVSCAASPSLTRPGSRFYINGGRPAGMTLSQ